MSSPVTGESVDKLAKRPGAITWAALAAIIQLGGLILPGAMRLQAVETKVDTIERDGSSPLQRHVAESNARYTEIIRALTRIETAMDQHRGVRRDRTAER